MATESSRIAATLSALLGQSFSLLHGQSKHTLTAETYHGFLCALARRTGLLKLMEKKPILYKDVQRSNDATLQDQWEDWAMQEMLKR